MRPGPRPTGNGALSAHTLAKIEQKSRELSETEHESHARNLVKRFAP